MGAGPAACGYEDQCWTLARIADQAWQRFGVEYTLARVHVLLHRMGWSVQVPARQSADRDEAAVAAWKQETWPVIKRTAAEQGAWLVFEDASAAAAAVLGLLTLVATALFSNEDVSRRAFRLIDTLLIGRTTERYHRATPR